MCQLKPLNLRASQNFFNQMIQIPCFFVHTIVAGIKPQVKLPRYQYLICSEKERGSGEKKNHMCVCVCVYIFHHFNKF